MGELPPLDRWRLDEALSRKIWGLKAIAHELGRSERTVKRWLVMGLDVPVHQMAGRYWADLDELRAWMKRG